MKLASDESRAILFVVGLIALATGARVVSRPTPADVPAAAEVDAGALEQAGEEALEQQRARSRPLGADERIDVNGAGADELDRLPGVGPGLAARIVEERERAGAYDSAADLRDVRGIGEALLRKLEPHLAFGPAPTLGRRAHPSPEEGAAAKKASAAADEVAGPRRGQGRTGSRAADKSPQTVARRPAGGRGREQSPVPEAGPVNVNRATAAELEALPGIGPALAARIVAKRDSMNGFRTLDDLQQVRGIGPATLSRLRTRLRL